jgi:hypothetical protein
VPVLNRLTGPRGARFYDEDGKTMFVHVLDGSTRFGPREANEDDMANHPAEWLAYAAPEPADGEFPGRPPIAFSDPPDGRPAPPQPKRRGGR